jgi:phosphate transport system permease protein
MATVRGLTNGLARLDDATRAAVVADPDTATRVFREQNLILGSEVRPELVRAADDVLATRSTMNLALWALALVAAVGGGFVAWRGISEHARSRNLVERVVQYILIAASAVAILTTAGIVLSMLFETIRFFSYVSPIDFFFGTTWDPRFAVVGTAEGGQFGLLPLLWGTLYISLIALLIAVPIGLLAAIYMAEYASRKVRAIAKPALEVLAGIPTIVYGFFALVTVGPFIRDFVAVPLGLGNSGSSVVTAGLVMGIMIIPFVSSLSDDIINAVPQSMRDGSLGLGATKSETVRNVVLPAALPGIVGAVLLAASRAIGETMIVVLAAGVATRISLNPFQEMTTITVKIVSQLTGDTEFTSPQTLVAFALGLTLFCVTLALNVYALYIVRKYREQYE